MKKLPIEDTIEIKLNDVLKTIDGEIPSHEITMKNVERVEWIPNEGTLLILHQEGDAFATTTINIPTHIRVNEG